MVLNNIKEHNNFLNKEDFVRLKNFMTSIDFPWFYSKTQTDGRDSSYLFHSFFHKNRINSSHYYHLIEPILDILKPLSIMNIRANLLLSRRNSGSTFHIDSWGFKKPKHKTAIFYVNTNNGYTLFEKDKKEITCVENKLIIFPSKMKHKAVAQTDTDTRIVINFNYFDSDL
tara:strand:+ start:219 stop:731 length:513 start_codon:yes stop_codon:yes gene_type:complete